MFQVILLPQSSYWDWVRACRGYVLKFGAHLTPDPEAAANYMAPRQAITLPSAPGAYPVAADIENWFTNKHPELRLDVIDVDTPEALSEVLERRVTDDDRFGQKQRPFYMLWPTEYPVITQTFGANPRIYTRFGMPGHEGVDIRALPHTRIFACADGEVYRVEKNPKRHSYGVHVRIRHGAGYRTVYGHLASTAVQVGDKIEAGQVIGTADSTGASVGSHLHLSLKQDYASEQRETDYPKDIIDPTSFLVWPDSAWSKSAEQWLPGKCLVGAHARIGGTLEKEDLELATAARLEALAIDSGESRDRLEQLRERRPGILIMTRLGGEFSEHPLSPKRFVFSFRKEIDQLYSDQVRYFEVRPNPNLESNGWGRTWSDGAGFGRWFLEVIEQLRGRFPEAKFGFPGLSPGPAISGKREEMLHFLEAADEAILSADWLGVNCYWSDAADMERLNGGRSHEEYRLRYPDKLLFVTEFGNPSGAVPLSMKAGQYLEFYRRLRELPGVGAAFSFALSARKGYSALAWRGDAQGADKIARLVGSRTF